MGRHKDTYVANWNGNRRPAIDNAGKIRIRLEIQRGDPGRPVDLCITQEELDSLIHAVREARVHYGIEQAQKEQSERALQLQLRNWDLQRRIKDLEQRNGQLEGTIERVHDVVHPDRSQAVEFRERPDVVPSLSNVAH